MRGLRTAVCRLSVEEGTTHGSGATRDRAVEGHLDAFPSHKESRADAHCRSELQGEKEKHHRLEIEKAESSVRGLGGAGVSCFA